MVSQKNKMTATNDQYTLGQPINEGKETQDDEENMDIDIEWGKIS